MGSALEVNFAAPLQDQTVQLEGREYGMHGDDGDDDDDEEEEEEEDGDDDG